MVLWSQDLSSLSCEHWADNAASSFASCTLIFFPLQTLMQLPLCCHGKECPLLMCVQHYKGSHQFKSNSLLNNKTQMCAQHGYNQSKTQNNLPS